MQPVTSPESSRAPIRVLCVDDNPLVVEALALKLRLTGGFEWLQPLSGAEKLLDEVREHKPDVVLLDLDMPGRDSLDALNELTMACPDVRVVIFTGHTQVDLLDRSIEAGASGYLSKHAHVEAVISALRRVCLGEYLFGPEWTLSHDEVR